MMLPEKSEAPLASLGVASWSDRAALRCFRVGGAPRGCGWRRVRCDQLVGGEADQPRRPGLSRGEGGRGLTVALAAVVVLASGEATGLPPVLQLAAAAACAAVRILDD